MIDGSGAPAAPMMLRCSLRQMFRKLRFQMIDDSFHRLLHKFRVLMPNFQPNSYERTEFHAGFKFLR
jgi:hypothetical protein